MKIIELHDVSRNRIGHLNLNGVKLEPKEKETFEYLTLYGFNIEVIVPVITKNHYNADILMAGTLWESKAPESSNRNTIKEHFKKASKQANKVIFDLRRVILDDKPVENYILGLFKKGGRINRMIIIRKNGKVFDIFKWKC